MSMKQELLFKDGLEAGRARRDEGMRRVETHAPSDWRERFSAALLELARSEQPFTSEDVTQRAGFPRRTGSKGNNAVGAIMSSARQRGWIKRVGFVPARRANQHATVISQWVGLLAPAPESEAAK